MTHLTKRITSLIVAAMFFLAAAFSQTLSEDWLKSEYTLLLAGYFTWPEEKMIDTFNVGVLASDEIYTQMSLKAGIQKLKEKPFRVINFNGLNELEMVHVLYVGERKSKTLKKISSRLGEQAVLIVSDSAKTTDFTMVNLLRLNLGGGKPFQINKVNIDHAGLSVSPKILFIGGSEDDLRDIYRDLSHEGDRLSAELDSMNQELKRKQKALIVSEANLEKRTIEINRLVQEIEIQTMELSTLSDSVNLKEMDLLDKIKLLGAQEAEIRKREAEINLLNDDIAESKREIVDRSQIIDQQLHDISLQTAMMEEQKDILDSQKIQIERQRMVLWLFLVLFVFIIALGFMSYRAYQIKKRANRILKEKNRVIQEQKSDILNQKEEIQTQRDELQKVNIKIEKQNTNITDSIYYALTIQQSILPDLDDLGKRFDGFIIYTPKDIVSGDFYWYANSGRKRSGEQSSYFAVVDCTGHGVPGGFLSMIGSRMLDAIVNEHKIDETDQILEHLDKRIRMALNQQKTNNDDGMDICICKITCTGGEEDDSNVYLSFSGAHRPLFILRQGNEVEVIRGDRRAIGGKHFNPNPFTKKEFALKRGDRIYLTSDGLMDQPSNKREKFSTNRFVSFLKQSSSIGMSEQKTKLEEEILSFMKLENQRDDITIMGIKL